MEWRRERDRHLHLHAGFTCANTLGAGAGLAKPASPHELLSLAAVLTKQNLPMHFKVRVGLSMCALCAHLHACAVCVSVRVHQTRAALAMSYDPCVCRTLSCRCPLKANDTNC